MKDKNCQSGVQVDAFTNNIEIIKKSVNNFNDLRKMDKSLNGTICQLPQE